MKLQYRRGFSVVELLVVIGVVGVLAGLILPAVEQVRSSAERVRCLNNLKQIGLALHAFHDAHGRFPTGPNRLAQNRDPDVLLGWMALILPQMGEEPVYQSSARACEADPDPLHNPPHVGLTAIVQPYTCPADSRLSSVHSDPLKILGSFTSYIGNAGAVNPETLIGYAGVFGDGSRLTQFTDGTSQTLMVGERPPPDSFQAGFWYPGWWYSDGHRGPNNFFVLGTRNIMDNDGCPISRVFGPGRIDNSCDRYHYWSLHPGGANFLFVDASARFLSYSAEPLIIPLSTRNGSEIVDLP